MIFVMDVGNTNIKCGMFQGDDLVHSFRITTDIDATSDQFGIQLIDFFNYLDHVPEDIEGIDVYKRQVAHCDALVVKRFEIDGDAVGRSDLILTAVAFANRACKVVIHRCV